MVKHYDLGSVLPSHFQLASQALGRDLPISSLVQTKPAVARSA
jgi:hypothetical protein